MDVSYEFKWFYYSFSFVILGEVFCIFIYFYIPVDSKIIITLFNFIKLKIMKNILIYPLLLRVRVYSLLGWPSYNKLN